MHFTHIVGQSHSIRYNHIRNTCTAAHWNSVFQADLLVPFPAVTFHTQHRGAPACLRLVKTVRFGGSGALPPCTASGRGASLQADLAPGHPPDGMPECLGVVRMTALALGWDMYRRAMLWWTVMGRLHQGTTPWQQQQLSLAAAMSPNTLGTAAAGGSMPASTLAGGCTAARAGLQGA